MNEMLFPGTVASLEGFLFLQFYLKLSLYRHTCILKNPSFPLLFFGRKFHLQSYTKKDTLKKRFANEATQLLCLTIVRLKRKNVNVY